MKESSFQLVNRPILKNINFERNDDFEFGDELELKINNNIQIFQAEDEEMREAVVILTLKIFECSEEEKSKYPFSVNIEIQGRFAWDESLKNNADLLKNMLELNAPAILYGYVRPLLTTLTVEADLPPLVIPMMNFRD